MRMEMLKSKEVIKCQNLFSKRYIKIMLLSIFITFAFNFSGVFPINVYSVNIINAGGSN